MEKEQYEVSSFLGLAPFLRRSIAGEDLMPLAQALLVEAAENQENADVWMNLSIILECIGQMNDAQNAQKVALSLSRSFLRPALSQPVSMRVLLLKVPGNLSTNTPLDCLFEYDDIELVDYFLNPQCDDFDCTQLPHCDVVMGAFGTALEREEWAKKLDESLKNLKIPMVNSVSAILNTRRDRVSLLLQNVEKICVPLQVLCTREEVAALAFGQQALPNGVNYPLIIRPEHSQGGKWLEKIADGAQLSDYLNRVDCAHYFLSSFVDYKSQDGLYRKMRIALVDGEPYACHMAISSEWKVHYVRAQMQEMPEYRKEERLWMENFEDFAQTYHSVWPAVREKIGLDYACMDCAVLPDGRLLIFELDHISVVHAMDSLVRFPYKNSAIARLKDALRDFLFSV